MNYLCNVIRILAFILLSGILLQTCSKQLIYTGYLLNQEMIASVFCINKNAPEKHCEGKCHLKKQLDHDTRQQEGDQKVKSMNEIFYLFTEPLELTMQSIQVTSRFYFLQSHFLNATLIPVFHPPSIS